MLSCPCSPRDPACCPREGVSVRGLWPPSGAGSASRLNGSVTSLRPSLPSFSEGSLRGNYRNKCRLLRTLLFPQVPARPGPPSRPRSASLGRRPARSLVQRGEGSLGGPSSAPHAPEPGPAPHQPGMGLRVQRSPRRRAAGSDIARPAPTSLLPIKSKMVTQRGELEASCLLLPLLIFRLGIRQEAKETAARSTRLTCY